MRLPGLHFVPGCRSRCSPHSEPREQAVRADVGGDLAKALGEVSERLARELDDDWVLLVQSTSASSASYLQLAAELGRSQLDDAKQTQILDAFRASIAYL